MITQPLPQHTSLDAALSDDLDALRASDRERTLRRVWNRRGAVVQTDRGPAVDFSSNDYLGLASDPRLVEAAARAMRDHGVGSGASRLISGNNIEHEALESEIAAFFGAERALTFSSGYAANVGAIGALVGRDDAIFSDALNHASVIDGCRLSRATIHLYPHRDVDDLARLLTRHRASARRALIVSDGLFSMDGDFAPLAEIVELAKRFDAWTYIDDAHAIGVVGDEGKGTASAANLHGQIDVTAGTLGKSFGAAGAFVYGSATLAHYLLNRARSFIFSTAMPPAQAAAAREAIRIARAEPDRRTRVLSNATRIQEHCHPELTPSRHPERSEGSAAPAVPVVPAVSPIIPIPLGDEATTMRIGADLATRGFLVGAVRPPTVPVGGSRLRITASAAHTPEQIDALGAALAELLAR